MLWRLATKGDALQGRETIWWDSLINKVRKQDVAGENLSRALTYYWGLDVTLTLVEAVLRVQRRKLARRKRDGAILVKKIRTLIRTYSEWRRAFWLRISMVKEYYAHRDCRQQNKVTWNSEVNLLHVTLSIQVHYSDVQQNLKSICDMSHLPFKQNTIR